MVIVIVFFTNAYLINISRKKRKNKVTLDYEPDEVNRILNFLLQIDIKVWKLSIYLC